MRDFYTESQVAKIDHAGNANNPNGNNPKGYLALGLDRLDYVDLEIFTLGMVHGRYSICSPGLHHHYFSPVRFFTWILQYFLFSPISSESVPELDSMERLVRRMYSSHVVDSTYCFVLNSIELSSKVETGHAINSEYLEELA